ncbi:MAG: 3-oxoacyl-[acyl-carrier-protein] synthase III C-terminal domain-containing protein [Dehalococcoidia bacterium]
MVGIASCGAYLPVLRLALPPSGERTVGNYDEDSITMAVEAAIDCLKGTDRNQVDAVYFASTTPPYAEKQCAALIACVLDLQNNPNTVDFIGSTRSATMALKAAMDAVKAGSAKKVLVVAADRRVGPAQSDIDKTSGDGAAAVLITDQAPVAIENSYCLTDEFTFNWRKPEDEFVRGWEERFIMTEGYQPLMKKAVAGLLKSAGMKTADITKAALYAPNARQHQALVKDLKLDPKAQVAGGALLSSVGNTGTALALMMLVAALEGAKPGDTIVMANFGDGADAYLLKVKAKPDSKGKGIKGFLPSKLMISNYMDYLPLKDLLKAEEKGEPAGSLTALWRERRAVYGCNGVRCKTCGTLQYPIQRVCCQCQTKDNFELVNLSEKKGKLVTFTKEMGPSPEYPRVWSVSELEGGCRFFCVLADADASKMDEKSMGMPVEMTFRRLSGGSGFHNYIWKCRPARG